MSPRKPKTSNRQTRPTSARKPRKSAQTAAYHPTPQWVKITLLVGIIAVLLIGFYWMFIRPYSYRWADCPGRKGYGVCLPCSYPVHGIDISHYQGRINWPLLAQNRAGDYPLHFIFLKATEGGTHTDSTFVQRFDSARRYGFIRGAYHYFVPRTDAVRQADFFIRTAGLQKGDLPPVLDVETRGKLSKEALQKAVKAWLDRVESHYGTKPILYTSYKFKMRYLDSPLFADYPYWIAHYYVDSVRYDGHWDFWQHTDAGTVPGIERAVDLNVFNGTRQKLDSLLLQSSPDSLPASR